MNIQTIIAALIISAALLYVGANIWRKIKAFSPKNSSCGSDCGCGSKSKVKL